MYILLCFYNVSFSYVTHPRDVVCVLCSSHYSVRYVCSRFVVFVMHIRLGQLISGKVVHNHYTSHVVLVIIIGERYHISRIAFSCVRVYSYTTFSVAASF